MLIELPISFVIIHFLALVSPGPDFTLVLAHSLYSCRRTLFFTALGIACGISLHMTYVNLGLSVFFQEGSKAFFILQIVGAIYLIFLGFQLFKPSKAAQAQSMSNAPLSAFQAWRRGFLTNALNIKATLFFVCFLSQFIGPTSSLLSKTIYFLFVVGTSFLWFYFLGLIFLRPKICAFFRQKQLLLQRFLGGVLLFFGLSVLARW